MAHVDDARIGLLNKEIRRVFSYARNSSQGLRAVRCDFTRGVGSIERYPIGPIGLVIRNSDNVVIGACVATRWPSYLDAEDAFAIAGTSPRENHVAAQAQSSGLEVHIPKTPAGDAWTRQLNSPVAAEPDWPPLWTISSVITPDPLDQKNWVIDSSTMYFGKAMPG